MQVDIAPAVELGATELEPWATVQTNCPALASPFFAPEFATAVGAARADCRVAVLSDGPSIVGFFPFHASRTRIAMPLGRKLADYQGPVIAAGHEWSPVDVLRRAGLRAYTFDKLRVDLPELRPYLTAIDPSPLLHLAGGYAAYLEAARTAGLDGPREAQRKDRRLGRAEPALRFELHDPDPATLAQLMAWKSAQYRDTGNYDIFLRPWVRDVVERVHATQTERFAGVLSCLRAGDRLVAAHLGLRSGSVLHSWFPAYDREHHRSSPGSVLLLRLAEAAAEQGVAVLDLGKGAEPYKARFATGANEVGTGVLASRRAMGALLRAEARAWNVLLRTRFDKPVRRVQRRWKMG